MSERRVVFECFCNQKKLLHLLSDSLQEGELEERELHLHPRSISVREELCLSASAMKEAPSSPI